MSYGLPATSLGLNPYGYSPYPSNALAPSSGPNPYAPSQPPPMPQPSAQALYPQPYSIQPGPTHAHRQLTRGQKIAIGIGVGLGVPALIVTVVLAVKHFRKPPQRIERGPMTYGSEGSTYLPQGRTGGDYQVQYLSPKRMAQLRKQADHRLDGRETPSEPAELRLWKTAAWNLRSTGKWTRRAEMAGRLGGSYLLSAPLVCVGAALGGAGGALAGGGVGIMKGAEKSYQVFGLKGMRA
jgi:hypothetical protein